MSALSRIELRHLRYFAALAETLHFGRAAERLGIAQPPLSQQIQALEAAIGYRLFDRRPVVRLTPAGAELHRSVVAVLAEVERGIGRAQAMGAGGLRQVVVGYVATAMLRLLPPIVREFRSLYPEVELKLLEVDADEEKSALERGVVELAFVRQRSSDDRLTYEPAAEDLYGVLAPAGHPLLERERAPFGKLAGEPIVHFPREICPTMYDQIEALWSDRRLQPKVEQQVRSIVTHLNLVRAGVGVAVLPECFEALAPPGVVFRPLDCEVAATIYMGRPKDGSSPWAAAFCETARRGARLLTPRPEAAPVNTFCL